MIFVGEYSLFILAIWQITTLPRLEKKNKLTPFSMKTKIKINFFLYSAQLFVILYSKQLYINNERLRFQKD